MEKIKQSITELVIKLGYYLYDITYEKEGEDYILRVMIENDTYIDIDDCVKVSKAVGELLDSDDPFKDPYMLEVTSAGAEKELRNSEEIERSVGKGVYVQTYEQQFTGILESFNDGMLVIKEKNRKKVKVNYMDVRLIRLAIML